MSDDGNWMLSSISIVRHQLFSCHILIERTWVQSILSIYCQCFTSQFELSFDVLSDGFPLFREGEAIVDASKGGPRDIILGADLFTYCYLKSIVFLQTTITSLPLYIFYLKGFFFTFILLHFQLFAGVRWQLPENTIINLSRDSTKLDRSQGKKQNFNALPHLGLEGI